LTIAAQGEGKVKLQEGGPRTAEIQENVRILKSIRHEGAHCPKCKSINVRATGGWYEFTQMHCDDCGNDDLLDEYQLEEWYG
jgi:hypothetical protein